MSRYTTKVRFLCETAAGYIEQQGYSKIEDILVASAPIVMDFPYPIFDEEYRLPLNIKILRAYYTREICEESVGLWKLRMSDRMNQIMPYYNQLYESTLLEFNPLYDTDMHTNYTKKDDGKNTLDSTSNTDNTSNTKNKTESESDTKGTHTDSTWNYYSDTPQGGIQGLESHAYLTNANDNENNGSDTSNTVNDATSVTDVTANTLNKLDQLGTVVNTQDYFDHVYGKKSTSSYSKYILEWRDTFLNIDQMIIEELRDLFFGLWE